MAKHTLHHAASRVTTARKHWESTGNAATLQRMARLDRKLTRATHRLAIKHMRDQ